MRTATTFFSTRVDREITSTVTVTRPAETSATDSGDDETTAEASATTSAANPPPASVASEGSMFVQTTGVSQGTPSIEEPTSTETSVSPDPTAPPFTCPDDDGMVISQMLGSERFDYDVFCDKDLPTSPELSSVLDLSYSTFSECVASCSYANAQFDQPVCQGAAYFETETSSGNCILKSAANATDSVSATGVNIAILRRIAVGVDENHGEGTNTEVVSFSSETPTMDPGKMGSIIMSMMGNSTSTMPIVTPPPLAVYSGRPVAGGETAYSTYISDGTTFSTGSAFSTYVSGNGSWYSAYFSSFSVAWTNAQTIYAAGETTLPVAYNNTGVTKESNEDGGYTLWKNTTNSTVSYQSNQTVYDVTEIIEADYMAPNGTQTSSSITTSYYSYTGAAVAGANSVAGSSDAGVITSSYSTQTVIYNSGFTEGGTGVQASGVIQTPAPLVTSTFSTQSVIASSGGLNGAEGIEASGAAGSTAPVTATTSTSPFSTQTVIVSSGGLNGEISGGGSGVAGSTVLVTGGSSVIINTFGTAGSIGLVLSGVIAVNGTSGATSFEASGAVPSTGAITSTFVDTTIILSTGGAGGAFSTAASGAGSDSGTSGVTSIAVSGEASPSTGTRSVPSGLRSGTDSESSSSAPTALQTSPSVPYPPVVTNPSGSIPEVNSSLPLPTGTGSAPFSQPSGPRVGTDSSSTLVGTGPVQYPPVETSPPTNETVSFPTSGLTGSSSTPLGTGPVPYPPVTTEFITLSGLNATIPAPTGTPSGTFTNTRDLRSGSDSSSTFPGTAPAPYPPLGTGPPSNVSVPSPIGTSSGKFTNTRDLRSGTDSSSTPLGTGSMPYPPLTTGPPSNVTVPIPTGTAPGNFTISEPTVPGTGSFTNSQTLREGTDSESTTSTTATTRRPFAAIQSLPPPVFASSTRASISLSTGGVVNATESSTISLSTGPPLPTAPVPTSCPTQSIGTTTLWMTTTLLGCFSQCPPGGNGGYGGYVGGHDGYGNGPQSFGPPAAIFAPTLVGNPRPISTSPAEATSA